MFTVYKYSLRVTDNSVVEMPQDAEVLAVREVDDRLWIWARVDTRKPMVKRSFRVAGTGHPLHLEGAHIDTVVTESGLVWHVFDDGVITD